MILAITMNPSVDISYPLTQFILGEVNRVDGVKKTAGGKGLNVARVVSLASHPVIASGFLGGTIGQYIRNELDNDKIEHDFYFINQESRNCIAILHQGYQTEILESGPIINPSDQLQFKHHFNQLIQKTDVITISGSLPKGVPKEYYAELIELANMQNKLVLLDCSGDYLKAAINKVTLPYLIKPNHEELGQLVNTKLLPTDTNGLISAIQSIANLMSIPIVVVSLGKEGALVKFHQRFFRVTIPKINAVNPVGSGDATLAGLAIGVNNKEQIESILKRAMTFGMLNAMEPQTGYININNYHELYNKVIVTEII